MGEWRPVLDLGKVKMTSGFKAALSRGEDDPFDFLIRHSSGDLGDLKYQEDRDANEAAVIQGLLVLSEYHLRDGTRFWLITEADRSVTTFLLPEEY